MAASTRPQAWCAHAVTASRGLKRPQRRGCMDRTALWAARLLSCLWWYITELLRLLRWRLLHRWLLRYLGFWRS